MADSLDVFEELASANKVAKAFTTDFDTCGAKWETLKAVAAHAESKANEFGHDNAYLSQLSMAIMSILTENTDLTLQHVEAWFRRQGYEHVWITGTENKRPATCDLMMLDGTGKAEYAMHVIVRKPALAIVEVAVEAGGSYAANFDRLATTGVMAVRTRGR